MENRGFCDKIRCSVEPTHVVEFWSNRYVNSNICVLNYTLMRVNVYFITIMTEKFIYLKFFLQFKMSVDETRLESIISHGTVFKRINLIVRITLFNKVRNIKKT